MQQEARLASRHHAIAVRDGKKQSNLRPVTEANLHASAHGQAFERTVFALSELGRFPVDLVERALLDKGEDMILILAKAVGCSWTTAKGLLTMYVAERNLQPDNLPAAFERYKKLTQQTACKVIDFYRQRMELRMQKNAQRGEENAESVPA